MRGTSRWFDGQQAILRKRKSRAIKANPEEAKQLTAKFKSETSKLAAVYWVLVKHGLSEAHLADQDVLSRQMEEIYPTLSPQEAETVRAANIPALVADEFIDFVDDSTQDDPEAVRQMLDEFRSGIAGWFSAAGQTVRELPAIAGGMDDEGDFSDISSESSGSNEESEADDEEE